MGSVVVAAYTARHQQSLFFFICPKALIFLLFFFFSGTRSGPQGEEKEPKKECREGPNTEGRAGGSHPSPVNRWAQG